MRVPNAEAGYAALLNNPDTKRSVKHFRPSTELANVAAETGVATTVDTIVQLRDQLEQRFGEPSQVSSLLTRYAEDRDAQMRILMGLGPELLLNLVSDGVMPAQIAEELGISYDTLHEYIRITADPQAIKAAQSNAADSLVAQSLRDINEAGDKEDLARAKALADLRWKIAKTLTTKYTEQKPQTAVQINNYGDDPLGSPQQVPYLEIVHINPEALPELKPHKHREINTQTQFTPEGIIEGEVILIDEL